MSEITDILTDFLAILRNEILDYYKKSYSYLKDLIAYKKINLIKKTETETEKRLKNTIEKMLKAIKTGLNTIGVSMDKLNQSQNDFLNSLSIDKTEYPDYNSYFENYLKNYVNKILFEILIEYLLEIDTKKLENVNLFDLLPPYFISKLNEFKKKHFRDKNNIELFKQQDYNIYINFTDLTIKSKDISELDILTQLREAKQDIIDTLKTPKKDVLKSSVQSLDKESISKEIASQAQILPQKEPEFPIEINSDTFLDYIGHFSPIHPDIINQFKIDKVSLINSKVVNQEFFDLENLYYFISIIKMLNLEFPFTDTEILGILKNFIKDRIFSSSKDNIPDSKNIFFGLAILSELDLLNQVDIIDLIEIEKYLKLDLDSFIPEKLELNLYSLLCLKLVAKSRDIKINKNFILKLIINLNLLKFKEFKPTLDIYNHLASIKLLDKNVNLNQFKTTYIKEIKKLITPNGSIGDLITESARALLILDLLNLKEQEHELCSNLLNFILNSTNFFDIENLDFNFNWRKDILGYKIELKMAYWALFASLQYTTVNY
ncbi:MAG: hypothetical protein ACFFDN_37895 [Candidatus Hodarchaeota archaeon]